MHRIEIVTGISRRRWFSQEIKTRIVLESHAPALLSPTGRRHGLLPQQPFRRHRKLHDRTNSASPAADVAKAATGAFTAVVVSAAGASRAERQSEAYARLIAERWLIEIAIGEVTIRLREGVAPRMIAAMLQTVRATS